jgi:hypothetical protein
MNTTGRKFRVTSKTEANGSSSNQSKVMLSTSYVNFALKKHAKTYTKPYIHDYGDKSGSKDPLPNRLRADWGCTTQASTLPLLLGDEFPNESLSRSTAGFGKKIGKGPQGKDQLPAPNHMEKIPIANEAIGANYETHRCKTIAGSTGTRMFEQLKQKMLSKSEMEKGENKYKPARGKVYECQSQFLQKTAANRMRDTGGSWTDRSGSRKRIVVKNSFFGNMKTNCIRKFEIDVKAMYYKQGYSVLSESRGSQSGPEKIGFQPNMKDSSLKREEKSTVLICSEKTKLEENSEKNRENSQMELEEVIPKNNERFITEGLTKEEESEIHRTRQTGKDFIKEIGEFKLKNILADLSPEDRFSRNQQDSLMKVNMEVFEKFRRLGLFEEFQGVNPTKQLFKSRGQRIKKSLKTYLIRLYRLGLSINEVMSMNVFSTRAYQKKGSRALIAAVKEGDFTRCKSLIAANKYLIYDFDHAGTLRSKDRIDTSALGGASQTKYHRTFAAQGRFGCDGRRHSKPL